MSDSFHGISIGTERRQSDIYLTLTLSGKLTHEDYITITPIIEEVIKTVKSPQVYALIDAIDFKGWELRAMWDDFQIVLSHSHEFKRVAIYGGKKWHRLAALIVNWVISGEVKYFRDKNQAILWIENKS
ncbi:STAS/SEC14 domain-containing protein [Pseudoalteromonas sp. J010]|uniref:STAS/SEC14 domain-containing protein n=1 Tax=Pseudoalteromonas sp. J010 TaxID=998465 RepID=UPI000F653C0A|nr:STAS/SEC14 domain-containing protein [Pseudoalteromonas sp. J010]RRS09378.1 STAS/SEC14 domain-containing protein [Pseudoalteromonas sp. J010]